MNIITLDTIPDYGPYTKQYLGQMTKLRELFNKKDCRYVAICEVRARNLTGMKHVYPIKVFYLWEFSPGSVDCFDAWFKYNHTSEEIYGMSPLFAKIEYGLTCGIFDHEIFDNVKIIPVELYREYRIAVTIIYDRMMAMFGHNPIRKRYDDDDPLCRMPSSVVDAYYEGRYFH